MAFFKQVKKQSQEMDDCEHLSALGDDPEAWDDLDDEELKQVIGVKFIEYEASRPGSTLIERRYKHGLGIAGGLVHGLAESPHLSDSICVSLQWMFCPGLRSWSAVHRREAAACWRTRSSEAGGMAAIIWLR